MDVMLVNVIWFMYIVIEKVVQTLAGTPLLLLLTIEDLLNKRKICASVKEILWKFSVTELLGHTFCILRPFKNFTS